MKLQDKYAEDYRAFLKDFIEYLKSTEESSWCMDVVRSKDGESNCLFGHLSNFCGHAGEDNVDPDFDWFENHVTTTYVVYPVNDGQDRKYPQETPKDRCIALMQAILDGEEPTTWEGMAICAEEWGKWEAMQELTKLSQELKVY